nr:MAG TPA: hypothetical protein [Caudoviricetes sp.]
MFYLCIARKCIKFENKPLFNYLTGLINELEYF